MLNKLFLPIGIPIFFLLAWIFPSAGVILKENNFVYIFIFIIFLVNGYNLELTSKHLGGKFILAFFIGFIISLIITPLLCGFIFSFLDIDKTLLYGIIIISSMPPTLSSGIVISKVSGGNSSWAILLTIGFNLLGALVIPLVLSSLFSGLGSIYVPVLPLLSKIMLLVLLPVFLGLGLKRVLPNRLPTWGSYIPPFLILLTLFSFIGNSKTVLKSFSITQLPMLILYVGSIHIVLLLTLLLVSKIIGLKNSERNSYIFVCSQKTLPMAMTVLAILFPSTGLAVIACISFHFFQVVLDSFIASILAPKNIKTS